MHRDGKKGGGGFNQSSLEESQRKINENATHTVDIHMTSERQAVLPHWLSMLKIDVSAIDRANAQLNSVSD